MSTERKGVEFFVGLFLLAGFGVIGVMVVMFGRVGQVTQKFYEITVEFPNASGIVKGSDVLLSGARVGIVKTPPELVQGEYFVTVQLKLREEVRIPRKSYFQIRTNGMLGDSFVDVIPPAKYEPGDFATNGERIQGTRTEGLSDLATKGGEMIDKLNTEVLRKVSEALDELKAATQKVNERLLNDKNLGNIEASFTNFKSVSDELVKSAKELDGIIAKAKSAVDSAQNTMKTVDGAAGDLKVALADFRKLSDSANKTVDSAKAVIDKINKGEGTLGMLVNDRQTAENFRALVVNMRKSGILFYKDRAPEPAAATPAPKRRGN